MPPPPPPCSDLPPELLTTIATLLNPTGLELRRLRAVCRSWRASLPFPSSLLSLPLSPLPFKLPPPPGNPTFHRGLFWGSDGDSYVLTSAAVYLVKRDCDDGGGDLGWLLFVDELNVGKLHARVPLSKRSIDPLPYNFPTELDSLGFRVWRVGVYNSLCLAKWVEKDGGFEKKREWNGLYRKSIAFPGGRGVVVLCKTGKMWFLRFGGVDGTECEVVHDGKGFKVDDVVEFKGRVYVVNRRGRVYVLDYGTLEMSVVSGPISQRGGGGWQKRLVESCGELYLVVRCCVSEAESIDVNFRVYRLMEKEGKWDEVTGLGNQIFFMGLDFAFSVSARELGGSCEGNCILYIKGSFHKYAGREFEFLLFESPFSEDYDVGVFHLDHPKGKEGLSVFRNFVVLWPPPPWLKTMPLSVIMKALKTALEKLRSSLKEEHDEAVKNAQYLGQSSIRRINRKLKRKQRKFSSMLSDNCTRARMATTVLTKFVEDSESGMQTSGQDMPALEEGSSFATYPCRPFDELCPDLQNLALQAREYLELVTESHHLIYNFKDHLLEETIAKFKY